MQNVTTISLDCLVVLDDYWGDFQASVNIMWRHVSECSYTTLNVM